jgi:hypothetical protein
MAWRDGIRVQHRACSTLAVEPVRTLEVVVSFVSAILGVVFAEDFNASRQVVHDWLLPNAGKLGAQLELLERVLFRIHVENHSFFIASRV